MSKLIETKFGKIEYTIIGNGQPIVFLHGGHSNCHETLFLKGYDLSQFQLILPSRPGYGRTPLGKNEQPAEAAKLVSSLLQQLKIEEIIIVGISAGGLTAIELAALLQSKAKQLILISAVTKKWLTSNDELYKKGKKVFSPKKEKFNWKMFRVFFRLIPRKMTKVLFEGLSTKKGLKITDEEIAEVRAMTFKQSSGNGFVADLDQEISEEIITNIQCPTLILHSQNDKPVKLEMAEYANKKIPNSELKIYDNKWGHLLWIGKESKIPIEDVNKFIKNKAS